MQRDVLFVYEFIFYSVHEPMYTNLHTSKPAMCTKELLYQTVVN